MNELWMMFQKGAGIGAWVVGLALVLALALPVFGVLFALIARVLRAGTGSGKEKGDG